MTRVVELALACCRLDVVCFFEIILRLVPCMIVILEESYN